MKKKFKSLCNIPELNDGYTLHPPTHPPKVINEYPKNIDVQWKDPGIKIWLDEPLKRLAEIPEPEIQLEKDAAVRFEFPDGKKIVVSVRDGMVNIRCTDGRMESLKVYPLSSNSVNVE